MVNLAAPEVQGGPVFFAENRVWLRGPHGTDENAKINATLDVASFPSSTLREGKYIQSGTVVARITSGEKTGLIGAYDPAGSNGLNTPVGILFNTVSNEAASGRVFNAILVHGTVTEKRLPIQTGVGSLDAAAKTALPHIISYA